MSAADENNKLQVQWRFVIAHHQAHIRRMAECASLAPTLRRLFPFVSLNSLRFSTRDEYPYDWDLPFVQMRPDGEFEARAGTNEVLCRGDLENVVHRVADAIRSDPGHTAGDEPDRS